MGRAVATPTSTGRPEANRKVAQSRLADDALIERTSHPRSARPSLVFAHDGNA